MQSSKWKKRNATLWLCVAVGGIVYGGYRLGRFANDNLASSWLLAETRSEAHFGTAEFLVDAGSFGGSATYFFVRDPDRWKPDPVCVGGPYISDGPIKMQQAVWSQDGSVIAVRVKTGIPEGKGFRRYDGAFLIDAYDFRKHLSVSKGSTIEARSKAIARLLSERGGLGSRTLSSPSIVGRSMKWLELRKFNISAKKYGPFVKSDVGLNN